MIHSKLASRLLFLIYIFAPLPVLAVDRNVPADFPTIQAAITVALPGDTVILAPGTYTGDGNRDIDLGGKALTLRSSDPNDPAVVSSTIIDCQAGVSDPHRALVFTHGETASTVIDGLTLTHGWADYGGAVYCTNSSSPTIRNCTITNNSANYYGGGIYCTSNSSPRIQNCRIQNNATVPLAPGQGGLDGGGIYCTGGSSPAISNCTISANSGKSGGGLYCNASHPTISFCVFTANTGSGSGGGIGCWTSSPTITNCLFTDNAANYTGGSISCDNYSNPTIRGCTFSRNSATLYGGGGIACNGSSNPSIKNSILWDNLPAEIKLLSGSPQVTYCDVKGGWSGQGNMDLDPLFADPNNGDFHLKSTAGRWDPNANGGAGGWVVDDVTSPCLDSGDPNSDSSGEPNGLVPIVDMGYYSNTPYASSSPGRVLLTTQVTGGNGTISPPTRQYNLGSIIPLTATPNTGYRVKAWTGTNNDPAYDTTSNSVTITAEKTVTVEFELIPVPGILTVDTTPIKGAIWIDGESLGAAPKSKSMTEGEHTISFGDISGYTKPTDVVVTMQNNHNQTITRAYVPIPAEPGTLSIDTTPVKGDIFVDGANWGAGPQSKPVTPGSHAVAFGDVAGYAKPASLTADVIKGQTTTISKEYTPIPILNITPPNREVTDVSGTTTFEVKNVGLGSMPWTSEIVDGATWLTIDSGASGEDAGTITLSYTTNISPISRAGWVRITATGATHSPFAAIVTQQRTAYPGDLNGDSATDVADSILAMRMTLGLDVPTNGTTYDPNSLPTRADFTLDGAVTIDDVIKIHRMAVGLDK